MSAAQNVFSILASAFGLILVLTGVGCQKMYHTYIAALDVKDYPLKRLIPCGLFFHTRIFRNRVGNRALFRKISAVYGLEYALFHYRVHTAQKIVLSMLIFVLVCAYGATASFSWMIVVSSVIAPIGVYIFADRAVLEKGEERTKQMQRAFPAFVGKFTLLLSAGLNTRQAFIKTVEQHQGGLLYEEAEKMISDMKRGLPEREALTLFAERVRIHSINRFVGILLQHMSIGGSAVIKELDDLCEESWIQRKHDVSMDVEQAQTKLIFPMMIMFIAIVLIVCFPALWVLQ